MAFSWAILAVPLGVAMGWWKGVNEQVDVLVEVLRPIPPLAWIPLSILWFGIGDTQNQFIPQVLLMDEPFAALDAQNRSLMQKEMVHIWERARKTCILVTHSIEEAITLSDRILVMTRRPGTIKADIRVDLPRPRPEDSSEVIALRRRIRELIEEELEHQG